MRRQRRPEVILSSGRSKFLSCLIAKTEVDGHIHLFNSNCTFILLNTIELLFMKKIYSLNAFIVCFCFILCSEEIESCRAVNSIQNRAIGFFIPVGHAKWKPPGSVTVVKEVM